MNSHSDKRDDGACRAAISDPDAVATVSASAPPVATIERVASIFDALSDATRVRILHALSIEPLCVCDIAEIAGVSQSGVSHQLRLLRDRGLVTFERRGQRAIYSLADEHVRVLLVQGLEHAEEERP